MQAALRTLLAEPRHPDPPGPGRIDRALVAVAALVAGLETLIRTDLAWPVVALGACLIALAGLPWRRVQPLIALSVAFAVLTAVDVASLVAGTNPVGLGSNAFVLLLPYALARWASGRDQAIGVLVLLAAFAVSTFSDFDGAGDAGGGAAVLAVALFGGWFVRDRERSRLGEVEHVKLREREQLARELHDTVAHHVSAMAIEAQAGQAILETDPDRANQALATIERSAADTLVEMRKIVGALRSSDEEDRAPQRGLADIVELGAAGGPNPTVEVELTGELAGLGPSLEAGLFRLAQEAVTNARRHSRDATTVTVRVAGERNEVHLVVADDGAPTSAGEPGFGLVGMTERAALLGGDLSAGPGPARGWVVEARLPKVARR